MRLNIALDGTAGSGKGTVARRIANKFGIYHLDSGGIFRIITYKCLKEKVEISSEIDVCNFIKKINIQVVLSKGKTGVKTQKNLINGKIIKDKYIRNKKVSREVSIIAQYSCVRNLVKKIQIELANENDLIIEGRDITTEILPNANVKFFLTAKAEVRAKRRLKQLNLSDNEFDNILKDIKNRDKRDSERKISPLKVAKDAYYIDNSNETLEETVARMSDIINQNKVIIE